jgi:hypothetical protein
MPEHIENARNFDKFDVASDFGQLKESHKFKYSDVMLHY